MYVVCMLCAYQVDVCVSWGTTVPSWKSLVARGTTNSLNVHPVDQQRDVLPCSTT